MKQKDIIFEESREHLLNIAYGMLGSMAEAEDAVQDAYLRWETISIDDINHPERYLKTIVSRLCIDRFRSAKKRREEYIGPWLPEPVTSPDAPSPERQIELHEKLSVALLHLLEHLSPDQRAILLLHDIFGYTFREIAEMVEKSPAACRKAAQRAREAIQNHKLPEQPPDKNARELIHSFLSALQERDMDTLKALLTNDAVMISDGGGEVVAARKPVFGLSKVSKFLIGIAGKTDSKIRIRETMVNHRPGFIAYLDGTLHSIWTFQIRNSRIRKIFAMLNPSKLKGKE